MAMSPQIKAAVLAAHGTGTAREVAERHGLTRRQVYDIWHRRPRSPAEAPAPASVLADVPAAAKAVRRATASVKARRPVQPVSISAAPPTSRDDIPMPTGLTGAASAIATIRSGRCRWPIGEPQDDAFHFCGEVQVEGKRYCADHCRTASGGQWTARRAA